MNARTQISILLLLVTLHATAQNDYRFYSFLEKDGLSDNAISCIAEDGNGFIWIGSASGLMYYDGYTFLPINSGNDSRSLRGSHINDLVTDRSGNLWIATESSVCKYDISTETFTPFNAVRHDDKEDNSYQADKIFAMPDGGIRYFAARMFELDTIRNVFVPVLDDLILSHKIRYCFQCSQGRFLMVSQSEKTIFYTDADGNEISRISGGDNENGGHYGRPFAIVDLGDDTFYIGGDQGIIIADFKTRSIKKIEKAGGTPMPLQIASLYKDDATGELWIGTNGEELQILSSDQKSLTKIPSCTSHNSSQMLNSPTVIKIFKDSRGLIWLCTWNGLSILNPNSSKPFQNLIFPECDDIILPCFIRCIDEAPNGMLAIGSDGGGITFWDKKSAKNSDVKNAGEHNQMPNQSVLAIAFDSKGNLYNGGYKHPLHRFSPDRKTDELYKYDPDDPDALNNDFINSILVENDTTIWVLTNGGGLSLFSPKTKKFKHIKSDKDGVEPCSKFGICMTIDLDGTIIVGSYDGIFTYDRRTNTIRNYQHDTQSPSSLSHNWVCCIYQDKQGRIWAGTNSGLNLFDKQSGTFTIYDQNAGFDNAVCNAIIEDDGGFLWVATSNGIAKFSTEKRRVVRIYQKSDGLLTNNFTNCAHFKDKDGTFFFGTNKGLAYFDPIKIKPTSTVQKPLITKLLIDYEPVTPGSGSSPVQKSMPMTDHITLTSSQSTFTLQYASPAYPDAASYTYQYQIIGDGKGWLDKGSRREIDFPNTAPGTHTIAIVAQNRDGFKSAPTSITITVLPPWYKTWFAQISFVTLIALAISLIIQQRFRNLKRQKQRLEAEVTLRTEEIKAQRDQLSDQNAQLNNALNIIKSKNIAIRGSITYAQTIQAALLTKESDFQKYFETATVYHPKDIVSGDFFWLKTVAKDDGEMVFASVIDCTGHGVPGAFMSIIANAVLNYIVDTCQIYDPADILSELSYKIATMLAQDCSDNKDGMDMALCRFDRQKDQPFHRLTYSGAKGNLYIWQDGDTNYQVIKADRKSVAGGIRYDSHIKKDTFQKTEIKISKGDTIYMSSDGILDMGNAKRQRFMRRRFLELLDRIHPLDMERQAAEIEIAIHEYSQGTDQRDDISVLGLRV